MYRIITLDILKAIGIVLVIVGHNTFGMMHQYIYSFHMPMFFMLAGFLFKERDVFKSIFYDFKRILFPYLFFYIFVCALNYIFQGVSLGSILQDVLRILWGSVIRIDVLGHHVQGIGYLWFLPALFICKNLFNIICKIWKKTNLTPKYMYVCMYVCVFGCSFLGYIIHHKLFPLPFALTTGMNALGYFALGHIAKLVIKDIEIIDNLKWYFKVSIVIIWLICGKFALNGMGTLDYSFIPYDYIAGITGTLTMLFFANIIKNESFGEQLAVFGQYTISVLIIHQFIAVYSYVIGLENKYIFQIIITIIVSILYVMWDHLIVKKIQSNISNFKMH